MENAASGGIKISSLEQANRENYVFTMHTILFWYSLYTIKSVVRLTGS